MTEKNKSLVERLALGRPSPVMKPLIGEARLLPGDRVPDFILPDAAGELQNFYHKVKGRPMALLLVANSGRQDQWDEIKAFAAALPQFAALDIDLAIVSNDGLESLALVSKTVPAPALWFADIRGVINAGLRAAAGFDFTGVVSLLLDPDQRLIAVRGPEAGHAAWALTILAARPKEESLLLSSVAPILLMPEVLDAAICRQLIEQVAGAEELAGEIPVADMTLAERVAKLMLRRVGPEVDRVFSFDDFSFEALSLRWQSAMPEAGPERRRVDLDSGATGRRFALLLDLDAGGYEGGEIAFPEYGPHRYRPGSGGAIVHSSQLLREIWPVTKGRQYLLATTLRRSQPQSAAKSATKG